MRTTVATLQRRRLARSIFPRLRVSRFIDSDEYRDEIRGMVGDSAVGGFVLFDGQAADVAAVATALRAMSDTLLLAADCEDGVTMRFAGGTEFPSMMALGAADDVSVTYAVARSIAREMLAIGLDWNFAPVADINTNPDNPIINTRSFGETPELVARHVHAYVRGLQDEGVIACAKHFPGHGDTELDSHLDLPALRADRERLESVELVPFREAISAGTRSIMTAHVIVPAGNDAATGSALPATLSPLVTGELLRGELAYDGVVVTDALEMKAVADRYSPGEAAVLAYLAGADVLETMPDPAAALDALVAAAADGRISEARIDATVRRLDALVEWRRSFPAAPSLAQALAGHDVIALQAARRSIRASGGLHRIYAPLFVLAVADETTMPKADEWFSYFSSWYPGEASGAIVTPELTEQDRAEMIHCIDAAGTVILALFVNPRAQAGGVGLSEDQTAIATHAATRPLAVLNFGNPYLLRDMEAAYRLDAFSTATATLAASIETLGATVG